MRVETMSLLNSYRQEFKTAFISFQNCFTIEDNKSEIDDNFRSSNFFKSLKNGRTVF